MGMLDDKASPAAPCSSVRPNCWPSAVRRRRRGILRFFALGRFLLLPRTGSSAARHYKGRGAAATCACRPDSCGWGYCLRDQGHATRASRDRWRSHHSSSSPGGGVETEGDCCIGCPVAVTVFGQQRRQTLEGVVHLI